MLEIIRAERLDLPTDEADLRAKVQVQPTDSRTAENFLSKFRTLRQLYRSPEIIRRIAREAIEDAASDHIQYLELRFTPVALSSSGKYLLAEVVEWILESAIEAAKDQGIEVGLIVSVNRHEGVQLAEQVAQIAADRVGRGIYGLDLAGNEASFPAAPFSSLFSAARQAGLGITIHAGEWTGAGSVRHALEVMGAQRIGHGVRVLEDSDVVRMARDHHAVFEVCPTSNLQSGVVRQLEDHPLRQMIQAGLKVTLNTDDPSVSNITLTSEYAQAVSKFGFSSQSLNGLVMVAAQSSFLPDKKRKALEARLQSLLPGLH